MDMSIVYSKITEQIKQKLQEGTLPWCKSWIIGLPQNYFSRRVYSGINFLSLCLNDYPSPYFLTYLQCKNNGGLVNKNEKGHPIIFWKILEENKLDSGIKQYPVKTPLVMSSYVFNLSQTNLYKPGIENMLLRKCEEILEAMIEKPVIKHNTLRCCYYPGEDYISLPAPEDFNSIDEYYSSLFHEVVHWTGSMGRLARFCNIADATEKAGEELVAELGSAYLCGLCGISSTVIDNQASYLDSWLSGVKQEPMLFIKAAVAANKAINYILNTL